MTLDPETFLTTLYVLTNDLYAACVQIKQPVTGGPAPKLSDSEVLCLGLAVQWRSGVPWQSERGFVRYALARLRPLFPGMTSQSAFNRRLRRLWGALILLQQAVAEQLWSVNDCEIMDCAPVPVARGARSFHPAGWPISPASAKAAMTATSWPAPAARRQCQRRGERLGPCCGQRAGSLAGRTAAEQPGWPTTTDWPAESRRYAPARLTRGLSRADPELRPVAPRSDRRGSGLSRR